MKTPEATLNAVSDGRVTQARVHTEDPARFYRFQWMIDGQRADVLQTKALDAAFQSDQVFVSWTGVVGAGEQPVTLR
jgi:hypothetical protein